jgi:NAD(P)H-flavin reductase
MSPSEDKIQQQQQQQQQQMSSSSPPRTPWTTGVPTILLKKTSIITADQESGRLPVYTLTFAIPTEDPDGALWGPAVIHSEARLDMGDVVKMVIPGYKPKSYSISELRDNEFDVTFKVYPNGRASGYLDRLTVGGDPVVYSFAKHAARRRNSGSYVGIIVFGVGITEGLPVAKAELEKGDAQKVVLLWASRTMEDTFWHDQLQRLKETYSTKFELVYLLSRQEKDGCLHGRISPQILEQVFQPPNKEEARFMSVGTKEMMRIADDMLTSIGYPMPEQHLLPKIKDNSKVQD